MYNLEIREHLTKILKKLKTRDNVMYEKIHKKVKEILYNPQRYKNLRRPLQHLKRVHFDPFVLTFSVDENKKIVILENFEHHDKVYL